MFNKKYFPLVYWPSSYWPGVQTTITETPETVPDNRRINLFENRKKTGVRIFGVKGMGHFRRTF